MSIDQIEELIRETIEPDTWDNGDGATITPRGNGTLFISHTTETHDRIQLLLDNLRNQTRLQVNVKIRALDVNKTFIEEIGFEWNDLTPNDLISNQITSEGFIDVNREWALTTNTTNELPESSLTLPFLVDIWPRFSW